MASKRTRPSRLLGVDLAVERLPAAAGVKRHIVRLAKQQREIGGAFVLQGLDRRIERDAGIAAAAKVRAGQHAADAAGADLAAVPGDLAAVDARHGRPRPPARPAPAPANRHGQTRCRPRAVWRPPRGGQTASNSGLASGQDVSPFKTSISMPMMHFPFSTRQASIAPAGFPKLRCLRPMEPSIRVPVKPSLPQAQCLPSFADITP